MAQPAAIEIVARFVDKVSKQKEALAANFERVGGRIDRANRGMGKSGEVAGNRLAGGMALASGAIFGAGIAAAASVVQAGQFNLLIRQAGNISKATAGDVEILRRTALEGAKGLGVMPVEAARTIAQITKLGISAQDASKVFVPAMQLVIASLNELSPKEAAKFIGQAAKFFGEKASDMEGIAAGLTAAFSSTSIDAKKLALSFSIVGSSAGKVGATFAETAAISALVGDLFITRVQRGATGARSLLDALSNTEKQARIERQFGIEVIDRQTGSMRKITDIFRDFVQAVIKMPPRQRAMAISLAKLGREAETGLAVFTELTDEGIERFSKSTLASKGIVGGLAAKIEQEFETKSTMRNMVKTFGDSVPGAFAETGRSFGNLATSIGTTLEPIIVPFLKGVADNLDKMAKALRDADPAAKQMVGTMAKWALILASITTSLRAISLLSALLGFRGLTRVAGGAAIAGVGARTVGAGVGAAAGAGLFGKAGGFLLRRILLPAAILEIVSNLLFGKGLIGVGKQVFGSGAPSTAPPVPQAGTALPGFAGAQAAGVLLPSDVFGAAGRPRAAGGSIAPRTAPPAGAGVEVITSRLAESMATPAGPSRDGGGDRVMAPVIVELDGEVLVRVMRRIEERIGVRDFTRMRTA